MDAIYNCHVLLDHGHQLMLAGRIYEWFLENVL
jgi:hypothetical protein